MRDGSSWKHRSEKTHDPKELCISSITYAELMHGVEKSQAVEKNPAAMPLFFSLITILNLMNLLISAISELIWRIFGLRAMGAL